MNDELSWWNRQVTRTLFTLWAGSWVTWLWRRKVVRTYDALMVRLWPYDRWPEEWRSVLSGMRRK